MGVARNLWDGLTNAFTGLGTRSDPRTANAYAFCPLTHQQIEAAYRGSGLMRKVIDIPALDVVREWRDWQADADQIKAIEAEEKRLGIRAKVKLAEILRGLGGGALIMGLPGNPSQPAQPVSKGGLTYINVANRWQLTAAEWIDDPTQPGHGGPRMWKVTTASGQVDVHPSRVICFPGDPLPNLTGTNRQDQFWGESRVSRCLSAVQSFDTALGSFAALISKARSSIVGIPGLSDIVMTADGDQRLQARLAAMQIGESMFNVILRDAGDGTNGAGETIDHRQVTWVGIPEIIRVNAEAVAAVADIPMTRLWGKAAEGMSASGDSQQRDWNKMVRAQQELSLRPCIEALDAFLIPSALGATPDGVWFRFAPLDTPTEAEETARFKVFAEAVDKLVATATVPDRAMAEAVQNTIVESGFLVGLDTVLAKIPEDERFGMEEPEPGDDDPSELQAQQREGGDPDDLAGGAGGFPLSPPARRAANDAAPRSLYVHRKLLNAAEFIAWAKAQGFETTTPADELHVTIAFSRKPLDWMKVGSDWHSDDKGELVVPAGGARLVEPLGDKGAIVLLFNSPALSWRHEAIKEAGASFDYEEYQPHVTITYQRPDGLDLTEVEPFRGALKFGPEIFSEVVEDWEKGLVEA